METPRGITSRGLLSYAILPREPARLLTPSPWNGKAGWTCTRLVRPSYSSPPELGSDLPPALSHLHAADRPFCRVCGQLGLRLEHHPPRPHISLC